MSTREVELAGGAPWGFRMHGGVDQNQPLRISRRFSDSVERILKVNPGRKASLSGIREGDIITTINGQSTKTMSNADAHAMLRSAGPVLKLGLNEDREMSPRRRSIGRASELRRPSQLAFEFSHEVAIPQAPVYATIRPASSPQNKLPLRSLNSSSSALSSTPLVKSVAQSEEPLKFHPTNPFYTTLPSNYSSASKLPVPNGKTSMSGLDKSRSFNKSRDSNSFYNDYRNDLHSSSLFSKTYDFEPNTLQNMSHNAEFENTNISDKNRLSANEECKNNPFQTKRNSELIDMRQPDININGTSTDNLKNMQNSKSDSDFFNGREIINNSITKMESRTEIEEIKTIKKIVLNGSGHQDDITNNVEIYSPARTDYNGKDPHRYLGREHDIQKPFQEVKPTENCSEFVAKNKETNETDPPSHHLFKNISFPSEPCKIVDAKPPVQSPSTPVQPVNPTNKRKYYFLYIIISSW